ncbi:MAG: serine hydrolase [Blastocatellia bacterium]|nr:serine hydrolase [Blastocatellia bacterium]
MRNLVSRSVVFAVASLVFASAVSAQQATAVSERDVIKRVDEYMKAAVEHERFSGSILIAKDGKPIVSKGYGMANVEFDAPNTPQTVFRLASVTKQFTAAAIMMLQERGKLSVNDPVCKHLAECPTAWQPITVRHLMTMTSGLPNLSGRDLGPLSGLPVPWEQWFTAIKAKPLVEVPGETFRYNNNGYTVLGLIIERLSGKTYGEFLKENIFAPLGMSRSGYEDPARIIKNRATGYRYLPGEPIANVPYAEMIRLYAAGGVYSTSEDLLKWDQALYTEKLLTRMSIDEMATPFREMFHGKGYGYGLWSSQQNGRTEIAHGGNLAGFITYLARFPNEKVTIIVLSNNGRGSSLKISRVLSSIVFGANYEIPKARRTVDIPLATLEKYVGEYDAKFPPTKYSITIENGKLTFNEAGFLKAELFAESDTDFYLKAADIQLKFIKDVSGTVTGFTVFQGDSTLYEVVDVMRVK